MAEVVTELEMAVSPNEVWSHVGGFNDLPKWLPGVAASEQEGDGVGALRTLTLEDGRIIRERQEARDDVGRWYRYSIVDGPLPLKNYLSTLSVAERAPGLSIVRWSSSFEPDGAPEDDVVGAIDALYRSGLAAIKEKLAG